MVNQLGKFTPNLAHLTQPLRGLLSKGNTWVWGPEQSNAFASVKEELSKPTILALYDPEAPTILSADASSYGLGAVATSTEIRRAEETRRLRITVHDGHGETLRPDRKGGTRDHLGSREVYRLHPGKTDPD